MKASSVTETAKQISKALISTTFNRPLRTRLWNSSLEQTLHNLGCRTSLSLPLVATVLDPFLINHHSLALGFFHWSSQQPGFVHTSLTYRSILKSLSISRQFSAVDRILREVKLRGVVLEPCVYRSVLDSFILGRKPLDAFAVFNDMKAICGEIGACTCNSLLAALSSDGCFDCAEKVFDEMSVRGVKLNTLGFGVFMWRFCGNAKMSRILGLLDKVMERGDSEVNGSIVAVLVVHGLCNASRASEAFWILDEMRKRRCKPDFIAYRVVAEAFRSMGSVVEMEKALKQKRKLGVAPRSNDYREFILNLILERRICEAKELGEVIVSGNFSVEDDVLNSLIGSVSSIDPDSAMVFLKFMVAKERLPTLLTLSNLSRNLCKHGKADELAEVHKILSSTNFFSDIEKYNVMISFLCKAKRMKDAYGILQEMKKKGLGPDVSSYNSLMEVCCAEDLLRPAKRLWDEMFASGCGGNLRTYNIIIQKFSEIGQMEDAQRLFHHMLEKGVAPNATTYRSLVVGLCQEKNVDAAFDVFNESVKQDIMLAETTLGTLVVNLCKDGNYTAASKLLCDLSIEIEDTDSHVILLRCLVEAGEIHIAIKHIKLIEDTSPSKLYPIATQLFGPLSSSSSPSQQILTMLRAMQKECSVSNKDFNQQIMSRD